MIGKAPVMQQLFELLKKVAPAKTSVLVTGESGTGKEMVARALHHLSPRKDKAFVGVNCGAIPESLIESELFGHVRGAFTGAVSDRPGLFIAADGGTLFLDEIGELSSQMQVKLLRVLQERKVKKVGGTNEQEIDVRVVAATNRDLEAEIERGAFRRDLFYRLNVIQLYLAPLRARREDIPLLVDHFVRKHAAALGRDIDSVSLEAMVRLCDYDFPGNVRELENLVERALTLESSDEITVTSLPALVPRSRQRETTGGAPSAAADFPTEGVDLERMVADFERDLIGKAMERSNGVRKEAARLLGISFRSFRYRLSKLGVASDVDEDLPEPG